jgi:hypothetical protein
LPWPSTHHYPDAENGCAVFEAGNDRRSGDVAGDARDKNMADGLVED